MELVVMAYLLNSDLLEIFQRFILLLESIYHPKKKILCIHTI